MSKAIIYHIDTFTNRLFSGNPVAVVPLPSWLPEPLLQAIATENNLSETAFFVHSSADESEHDFLIRWFTPTREVPLCGHATLASAAALFQKLGWHRDVIRFATRSVGLLRAFRDGATGISLDFPAHPPVNAEPPARLATALGRTPQAFLTSDAAEMTLAVLASAADVRAVTPDPTFIATLGGIVLNHYRARGTWR